MSQLFEPGKLSLAIYSFMFGPERERPCPGCTHMLDALDGAALHIGQRTNLWMVAKSPLPRIQALAKQRGWRYLRFLSTDGNSYDRDYFGDSTALTPAMRRQQEFKPGEEWDMPMLNVFQAQGATIRHCWGQELLYVPPEPGQQYRHNDLIDPLWNLLDCLPEGRGDFEPETCILLAAWRVAVSPERTAHSDHVAESFYSVRQRAQPPTPNPPVRDNVILVWQD